MIKLALTLILAQAAITIPDDPKPQISSPAPKDVVAGITEHLPMFDQDVKMAECEQREIAAVRYDLKKLNGDSESEWRHDYKQLLQDWNALAALDRRLEAEYAL